MHTTLRLAMAIALPFALAACGGGAEETSEPTAETTAGAEATDTGAADLVDTAVAAGQFQTLVQAVTAADLVETLKGPGPFTVFAPTDQAFAALPDGALEELLANPEQLRAVLLYHVVSGDVRAADVVGLDAATTVQGADVAISVEGDTVMVGDATVVQADVTASNGVIHVIDAVLLPPQG